MKKIIITLLLVVASTEATLRGSKAAARSLKGGAKKGKGGAKKGKGGAKKGKGGGKKGDGGGKKERSPGKMGSMGGSILPHSTLDPDSIPTVPSTTKADGATLAAKFGLYPGYVGKLMPDGEAIVRFNMDGSFHLKLDVAGVEQDCTACGVHIHTGTTCDNATLVGGHYWDTAIFGEGAANDPWNVWGFYETDNLGMSTTAFAGDSGAGYELNVGRAAVLHAADGTRIACGLLEPSASVPVKTLQAELGAYPGYVGTLTPSGLAVVELFSDNAFKFTISVMGVAANCMECGVHIHTGTTCANASLVGGHYWNTAIYGTNMTDDPWTAANGAFYTSNYEGAAKRHFYLDQGYGYEDTLGHAVVIHDQDGSRISCGTLSERVQGARK